MMEEKNRKQHVEAVCPSKKDKLDLETARARIAETKGPEYWRSLEELAGSTEFQEMMHREFPKGASEWADSVSRRGFMKLMGASLAMAGMTACTKQPLEPIVPYVQQPEEVVPGRPMFFASAFSLGGYASPVLVESHLYRPTKVEGNDKHPASMGGTDVFAQASVLDMYDPDRSQNVTYRGELSTWGEFMVAMRDPLIAQNAANGAGIRILTGTVSSPTLADQFAQIRSRYPEAKWHVYEPVNRDNVIAGAQMAFGQPVETTYKFDAADVIVSLDADFLYAGFPGTTRYARDFAKRRNPDAGNMSRMYVIESTPSSTGAKADHHLPVRASDIEPFARALVSGLGSAGGGGSLKGGQQKYLDAIVKDLQSHRGSSVVIAGDHQPPAVHVLVHAINQSLGNVGKTVFYTEPVNANPINQTDSLKDLIADMRAGKVQMLVIAGVNPLYDAPPDLGFADALKSSNIPLRVHLGLYQDETSQYCHWHINEAHYLESWGDARAYDGTVSIVQPLIAPLYGGKSVYELMALFAGQTEATGHGHVQNYWRSKHTGADFDAFWRKSLHDGWIEGSTFEPKSVTAKGAAASSATSQNDNSIEINFRRDPSIYDGRFSNNGWLQELPKPMTKMTWDNPLLMGPAMAERMGVKTQDLVRLELNGKNLTVPVWIQAGHPDYSVTCFLGYGRARAGRVGTGAGFDMYPLRFSATPWFTTGVKISKAGGTYLLASTQGYQTMETQDGDNRPLVRTRSLDEYQKEPNFAQEGNPPPELTLYPGYDYAKEPYAWGMTIDLNACVGCNNCILACQSENNIPIVGKEQVNKGRHMHWLRVDAYYQGDRDNPKAYFQPVPCMQCENAPCELVCPVGATTHSSEGLNDMVYNRCVGTRYCSNNCPYKVRRFNFFLFQDWETPQFKMMRNPDVTVRSRGVMEKCTYCVQRINHHRIDSEVAGRKIADGELQTACQQSCPANAISFGNINDKNSQVSKQKSNQRNYGLLQDLNTRPRTTYLAEIRNPNPELEA
ncbi:MAG TPA: TAT-variant-translocated molybdopterin oxidoreductase [Terriglobales bacterium]|jgi:molybdopterin-containing oxidoreductase family iron-sulfur binding subunit|nr:TAT-variant-translocated molybdopterin oxidoreductase [Terriglobales bacterium]